MPAALKEKRVRRELARQFNGVKGRVKRHGISALREGSACWPAWRFFNAKTEQFLMVFDPVLMRWWDGENTGYSLNVREAVNRVEKLNRLNKSNHGDADASARQEVTSDCHSDL